ncbi:MULTISPECIES: flagellar export chaperone FlgN [Nocardioides]|uniref:Flagellar export chaperone FlgN n=1 Tax=Nocardioides vastitatis TaxID=2568655 RepID=A0ABW0ZIQ0_9ACTN|nr:flagellar export chaperone FlgN [Nocardioides sp.]THI91589.1 flagellar protein FlgN [Nocardioides sp.]
MDRLSQILWRERELLETLSYKLEVERLVLARGRVRWLVNATREVEQLRGSMRATEVLRAVAADEAAAELGLMPNPSLTALAEACSEPWRGILLDHRDALTALAREIAATSEDARDLLAAAGYGSARPTLVAVGGGREGHPTGGGAAAGIARRPIVDRGL